MLRCVGHLNPDLEQAANVWLVQETDKHFTRWSMEVNGDDSDDTSSLGSWFIPIDAFSSVVQTGGEL